jgi:hypothetical protein
MHFFGTNATPLTEVTTRMGERTEVSRRWLCRTASSGMLRHIALATADVSKEPSASIIRVTRICEPGTALVVISNPTHAAKKYYIYYVYLRSVLRLLITTKAVPSSKILVTLMMEALRSSETSVLTRPTRRNILEDRILHSIIVKTSNLIWI